MSVLLVRGRGQAREYRTPRPRSRRRLATALAEICDISHDMSPDITTDLSKGAEMRRKDWDFSEFVAGGFGPFFRGPRHYWQGPRARRWGRWFEPGEMRLVILRLIREKPRHGYEII